MECNDAISKFRDEEYPMLHGKVYLDHGGSTIYAKSMIESFSKTMLSNLYGNPHSASSPAKLSGEIVDSTRENALRFFGADPEHFDLIFVANATAGAKLVMEAFRDLSSNPSIKFNNSRILGNERQEPPPSFWYGYHKDAHTSLVGIREVTHGNHHCFSSNAEVEAWIHGARDHPQNSRRNQLALFAYPAQSNMTGSRLPLSWPHAIRNSPHHQNTYTLLDAAAYASTAPLQPIFCDPSAAPDFTILSFYKIFGFPDLGALLVRKDSGHILEWRKYFGGGTVDMVVCLGDAWCKRKGDGPIIGGKQAELHDVLEDGTVPFHSIIALDCAISVHKKLYGSMSEISLHVSFLVQRLYHSMKSMMHQNGKPLCVIYGQEDFEQSTGINGHGGTIAFNLLRSDGSYITYSSVEKTTNQHNIFVRTGGLCNPGGIASHLDLEPWQMKRAWTSGHRCGHGDVSGTDLVGERPTGVVRCSFGAMSTLSDVDAFLGFLTSEFMDLEEGVPAWEVVVGL